MCRICELYSSCPGLWASALLYAQPCVLPILVPKSNNAWFSSSISLPQVVFFRQQLMKINTCSSPKAIFNSQKANSSAQKDLLPIPQLWHVTLPLSGYNTYFHSSLTGQPEDFQPYFSTVRSISFLLPDTWGLSCSLKQLALNFFHLCSTEWTGNLRKAGRQVCMSPGVWREPPPQLPFSSSWSDFTHQVWAASRDPKQHHEGKLSRNEVLAPTNSVLTPDTHSGTLSSLQTCQLSPVSPSSVYVLWALGLAQTLGTISSCRVNQHS